MGNQTGDKVYYLKGLMPDVLDSESDIYDGSKVLRDEHLYLYDNKVMFTTGSGREEIADQGSITLVR